MLDRTVLFALVAVAGISLSGCSAIMDLRKKPAVTQNSGTVIIYDGGGGQSTNDQYILRGSISSTTCNQAQNGDYSLRLCAPLPIRGE